MYTPPFHPQTYAEAEALLLIDSIIMDGLMDGPTDGRKQILLYSLENDYDVQNEEDGDDDVL